MSLIRRATPEHPMPTTREADPLRWWMRWDPFREMAPWLGAPPAAPEATFSPAFEVKETKEAFLFKADVPGMKETELEVKLTGERLTISGKREAEKEEKDDTFYAYERSYGTFLRAFTLPSGIDADHVHADLKDGVLCVVVPKKAVAQGKTVAIKGADAPKS